MTSPAVAKESTRIAKEMTAAAFLAVAQIAEDQAQTIEDFSGSCTTLERQINLLRADTLRSFAKSLRGTAEKNE